jgi:glutamyl-tRNA synthetase
MSEAPRVRFAPSPTGYLHVGGARTALFNWLYARQTGGTFVLRIEDTDRERSSDEMTRAILDGMRWLGLDWDEGPFHQADNAEQHRADAQRLLASGAAYRCFCTPEQLEARRAAAGEEQAEYYRYDRACLRVPAAEAERRADAGEPFTVRFRVPDGDTRWDDLVHGSTGWKNDDIEDFIVLRTDGTPVYNLAVVSDDIGMRITHVLRGDDHLANTPKQILLYRALGAEVPRFGHLPMILGPDGKRLSKRHGATAVGEYAGQGILPVTLVNFLALLGWNPGDDQELMAAAELVARFSIERINRKSAVFDPEKLAWMNGQHLMRTPAAELLPLVAPLLVAEGLASDVEIVDRQAWFLQLIDLLKPRARLVPEIARLARMFLASSVELDADAVEKHWKNPAEVAGRLERVGAALQAVPEWTPASVEAALRAAAEAEGIGFGKLVHPLRVALTGTSASPGIDQVILMLGRDGASARIDQALRVLATRGTDEDR